MRCELFVMLVLPLPFINWNYNHVHRSCLQHLNVMITGDMCVWPACTDVLWSIYTGPSISVKDWEAIFIWCLWRLMCTFHMFCLYIHTLTLTAGDKQASGGQSCSPHGPRLIRVSCHKGRNTVRSHITHINTPELKWVACVSGYMPQSLFLVESCPFIIQSWET